MVEFLQKILDDPENLRIAFLSGVIFVAVRLAERVIFWKPRQEAAESNLTQARAEAQELENEKTRIEVRRLRERELADQFNIPGPHSIANAVLESHIDGESGTTSPRDGERDLKCLV